MKYTIDENEYSGFETVKVAFGKGFSIGGAFGLQLSKYLGVELEVRYFMGLKTISEGGYDFSPLVTKYQDVKGKMLQVIPALVLSPGLEKFNPYMRFGVIVGAVPVFFLYTKNTPQQSLSQETTWTDRYHGGVAIGYTAAAGCDFNLSKLLTLYGEVNFNGIDYSPKYSTVTAHTVGGADKLWELTVQETETEYVNEYNFAQLSSDKPLKALKVSYPFSNVEINLGVKLRF